jgi:DNA-binding SARP family transcriptional activator
MDTLGLELLGAPHISLGGRSLTGFTTMKAQALLIYLAMTRRVHSRDVLANLLWPDMPEWQAKKNLRNILPNLRALVGSHVLITRHTVAFNRDSSYRIDVEVFQSALAASQTTADRQALREATALYRDSFLAGFYVRDAPAFEDWVLLERENLQAMAIDALLVLARQCLEGGDFALGLATTSRLLALDPWRETAHQYKMLLLAYSGQRSAALTQYDTCRTVLAAELGVEPMEETTALYSQIKAGALTAPPAMSVSHHPDNGGSSYPRSGPASSLPISPPPAVKSSPLSTGAHLRPQIDWPQFPKQPLCAGRDTELSQLYQWLVVDKASLVGLFGLGGQGKTTLAAQLAWSLADGGPFERIAWRSLVNAPPFATVLQRWLAFLGDEPVAPLPGHVDEQLALLLAHLQRQRCLLILDNVEGVLDDGVEDSPWRAGYRPYGQMLSQIARSFHRSCLVLISRERPQGFDSQEIMAGDVRSLSVQGLTEEAVAHLWRSWGLTGSHDTITVLMERYGGHPTALKLVAMAVQEFFAGNLEAFLATTSPIFDDLRTILDQHFVRLSALEKAVLCRLASAQQPLPFQDVYEALHQPSWKPALLEAVRALQRRSLLNTGAEGLCLPRVVNAYIAQCVDTEEVD